MDWTCDLQVTSSDLQPLGHHWPTGVIGENEPSWRKLQRLHWKNEESSGSLASAVTSPINSSRVVSISSQKRSCQNSCCLCPRLTLHVLPLPPSAVSFPSSCWYKSALACPNKSDSRLWRCFYGNANLTLLLRVGSDFSGEEVEVCKLLQTSIHEGASWLLITMNNFS